MLILAGEASVREANARRFKETVQREFEAFKKERLASGELECQKLITAAQSHLTQVGTSFSALQIEVLFSPAFRSQDERGCVAESLRTARLCMILTDEC